MKKYTYYEYILLLVNKSKKILNIRVFVTEISEDKNGLFPPNLENFISRTSILNSRNFRELHAIKKKFCSK